MPDKETVIDKLNDMADYLLNKSYSDLLARDFYDTVGYAIALLEKQERVEPFHKCIGNEFSLIEDSHYDYCPYCGKHITWEGR